MFKKLRYILWYKEINKDDGPLVGGKNASLGEMFRNLTKQNVNLPDGFCLTSKSFWYFLKENKIDEEIKDLFGKFDKNSLASLRKTGKEARSLILKSEFPKDLRKKIIKSYKKLSKKYKTENADVAVRSSATAEDLATASFAGQMETFLNIKGEEELLLACKKCIASLFTDRSIAYREEKGFNHLKIALSVGVQKMVRSDLASSGVMFTLDTETGFEDVVLVNSIWGIGEMIVQGKITPDEFFVHKPTFKKGFKSIIVKNLGRKNKKFIYAKKGGLKEVKVKERDQFKFSLTDKEVMTLADWAMKIQEHYGKHQDIEWAKDGKTKKLFIVQSRPETVHAPNVRKYLEYDIKTKKDPILEGIAIGNKIGSGKARVISNVSKIEEFKKGEVLVTKMTDPDWVPIMKIAEAIITDEGGKTCFGKDTKILTNKGLFDIESIVNRCKTENIYTPSLNKKTLKLEWKKILKGFSRKSSLIKVNVSQTGRMKNNYLEVTPDHKFLNFDNRKLNSEEINKIINSKKGILGVTKIPSPSSISYHNSFSCNLAYLQGAIITDGHIVFKKYSGKKLKSQLFFIQKITPRKKRFIEKVKRCFYQEYNYNLHLLHKKAGGGIIRGRRILGSKDCISLKCYRHNIVKDFLEKQKNISTILINANKEFIFNFLAGVVDGDGTFNRESSRINIFCSKKSLLDAVTIACLRLNINFQVSNNRNIWNVQIIDRVEEIFKYTVRVKGKYSRKRFGVRFLPAKQLLEDIIEKVNYKGRVLPYVKNNLLIDAEKIKNYIIPMIKGEPENHALTKIINSPLRVLRASSNFYLEEDDVYNIEVEDNHNYLVFTKRNTSILVENCHAAIVSRELGIPNIVGTEKATKVLKTGQILTADCTQGLHGRIFEGKVAYDVKEYNLKKIPKLKTKVMLNIGAPEAAFTASFLPVAGVGLAREEFIITEKIRVHPLALYHYKELKIQNSKSQILNKSQISKSKIQKIVKEIDKITVEHKDKKEFFIKELAEGIAQISAAFYPREVIVRFSDFKTNEYRNLIGGSLYEGEENNPMMGFRGAARYLDESFQPAFKLECQAIKRVRETFGLENVSVMVPFCRTIEEGEKVKKLIGKFGLKDVKIYVMAEVPSNVILADEFLKIFDGMSIGSNDLTQLTLGLDRDNGSIAYIGDETNEAVKKSISKIIKACKAKKKYCGICGDAPSSIPGFAKFLKNNEIPSMSLSSDVIIKTIMDLSKK